MGYEKIECKFTQPLKTKSPKKAIDGGIDTLSSLKQLEKAHISSLLTDEGKVISVKLLQ
jgi:hypothetical protein